MASWPMVVAPFQKTKKTFQIQQIPKSLLNPKKKKKYREEQPPLVHKSRLLPDSTYQLVHRRPLNSRSSSGATEESNHRKDSRFSPPPSMSHSSTATVSLSLNLVSNCYLLLDNTISFSFFLSFAYNKWEGEIEFKFSPRQH